MILGEGDVLCMTIYDFIKTHTIDEIAEEVTKDLDAGTDLQLLFRVADIVNYNYEVCAFHNCKYLTNDECKCLSLERVCPCLEDQKKIIKEEIKYMLNQNIEGD